VLTGGESQQRAKEICGEPKAEEQHVGTCSQAPLAVSSHPSSRGLAWMSGPTASTWESLENGNLRELCLWGGRASVHSQLFSSGVLPDPLRILKWSRHNGQICFNF